MFQHEFTTFTGEIVTIRIDIPLNECRLHRKIEKDIKDNGPFGNPCFSYFLSKEEHEAIKERFLSRDLFSKHKIKIRDQKDQYGETNG